MSEDEINRAIAEHIGADDRWLIVKRGYFYRPNGHGYTSCECNAWVLPLVEAKKHEYLIGEEKVTLRKASIPNYSRDLNAMQSAIIQIRDGIEGDSNKRRFEWGVANELYLMNGDVPAMFRPASDWCKALLKFIGKWKEAA